MSRLRTLLEWAVILVPLAVVALLVIGFYSGTGMPAAVPSGLPDGSGGFYQDPVSPPQQFVKTVGDWHFTFPSSYNYTLAGKVVGRHEYPAAMPDGIIALDLAVVNGELLRPDILSDFQITMGDHTLEYSYDIPNYTGLTEDYIDTHISNNHLVFLDPGLESAVKSAQVGSCLVIGGHLVDIRGSSPAKLYIVNTSTVRNDAYPGGCEIILVESYRQVSCGNER
ncbi:MAG TPA: hypothetical protein VLY83_04620 [Methanoregula sp.]|nr:hypothetical protein [Methanoregula sp.]